MPSTSQGYTWVEKTTLLDSGYNSRVEGKLHIWEHFWVNYQPFILRRGYRLRPRYQPGWVASWLQGNPESESGPVEFAKLRRLAYESEDFLTPNKPELLDAVRVSDGRKVVMKWVETSTEELPVARYLSSEPLASEPHNHAVPVIDVLPLPDDDTIAILVMPLLLPLKTLPFRYVAEFAEAVRQYLHVRHYVLLWPPSK
ncbi:hypothetical protein DXG03_002965 [Asterophora parasitica]|uniref:Uncharacterized protein n=1 Tax=Asterophora parasitica TaxID=117018 RepID=A0A9P7G2E9_9AGAR|nr:hypothetical protein DXG03_002965 [Asterophora parasitica]